ncbi:MAG: N-acetylglutamate synthase-like GNAT family acetyltransferase [Granulosicoccus sp.]|jgi:N-acetylglutamate synthase-like GNAT family acetyltransferase
MELELISEFQINGDTSEKINHLLKKCFPYIAYNGRDYFKQLPHSRILAWENSTLIGQVGIDFRVMNLNNTAISVFGVVDLCVDPEFQGQGIGNALMVEFERIATSNSDKIDFMFLVTNAPSFYEKLGFSVIDITTSWLKIHNHKNNGIGNERIKDAFFLIKSVSSKKWNDGTLDLLGYMY